MGDSLHGLEVDTIDDKDMLDLALGSVLGSQVKIEAGKYRQAEVMQEQADLWLRLRTQFRDEKVRTAVLREEVASSWRPVVDEQGQELLELRTRVQTLEEIDANLRDEIERINKHRSEMAGQNNRLREQTEALRRDLDERTAERDRLQQLWKDLDERTAERDRLLQQTKHLQLQLNIKRAKDDARTSLDKLSDGSQSSLPILADEDAVAASDGAE